MSALVNFCPCHPIVKLTKDRIRLKADANSPHPIQPYAYRASQKRSSVMQTLDEVAIDTIPKTPWNKGKLLGSKPPLQTKQVWAIRTKLQVEHRLRDLAMFNLAIDSKLRGCDLVRLKVEDVAPHGFALERATVRQRKTGHPVKFELTEQTREAIDAYIGRFAKRPGDFLFASRRDGSRLRTTTSKLDRKRRIGPENLRHSLPAAD
jgi:integrase